MFQMPRKYIRKTDKAAWTAEDLKNAKTAISRGLSIRKAADQFKIPFSTLQERMKSGIDSDPSLGRKCVFPPVHEAALADHVKTLSKIFYGITALKLRKIAFEYAERNLLSHRFDKETKMAGLDWMYGFMDRNKISVRKPEATSIGRAIGFNKDEVNRFFQNLEQAMDKYKFKDTNYWNVDETGITTVQDPGLILAERGQKRVGSITSWERGKNITVVCAMSSGGLYAPPMFIFPRARMSPLLEKNGPPGSVYSCSKTGWINEELFVVWLKHFAQFTHASNDNKMLLILDNHSTHCSSEAYDICREKGIVMVSLPPHTSHRLQPLDVVFYSPLKTAYKRECDLFMKSRNLVKITPYDVAEIFNKAYSPVATIAKATSGFKNTGIHPLNPGVFTDEDFLVEDILQKNQDLTPVCVDVSLKATANEDIVEVGRYEVTTKQNLESSVLRDEVHIQPNTQINVSIQEISPLPGCSNWADKPRKGARQKQHSQILTSTPMKILLQEKKRKREEKETKIKEKLKRKEEKNQRTKRVKKEFNGEKKKPAVPERKTQKVEQKKMIRKLFESDSDTSIDEENICEDESESELCLTEIGKETCFYCEDTGKDGEIWYRCTSCALWAHQECSGWDTPEGYLCGMCSRK